MYHFKIYGNTDLLSLPKFAIHASRNTPEIISEPAKRVVNFLVEQQIAIGGGWQSKIEKQLLKSFPANAPAALLIFIAKNFKAYTLPAFLTHAYAGQKIAIIEPDVPETRISQDTVEVRDQLIDDLIDHHIFLYIESNGRLEKRWYDLQMAGKQVYLLKYPLNEKYVAESVHLIDPATPEVLISRDL